MEAIFGGVNEHTLASGARLSCGDFFIEITPGQGREGPAARRVDLPRPSAGLGGVELVVGLLEAYVALFYYSGQSQQGYKLFELPSLRELPGLDYVQGQGMAPVFAMDGSYVVMLCTGDFRVRDSGQHAEEVLGTAGPAVVIDWAQLWVQELPSHLSGGTEVGEPRVFPIGTRVSRSTDPDEVLGWGFEESPWFDDDHELAFKLPGGTVMTVDLPPRGPLLTR